MCPGCRAVANHPAGATRRLDRFATCRAAFALTVAGSASGATHFRGHLAFTVVTARQLAPIPRMRLSRGFRTVGFPSACPPSYGASDCYPGRTDSCGTHQPFLDAQPYMHLSTHTAQASNNTPARQPRTTPPSLAASDGARLAPGPGDNLSVTAAVPAPEMTSVVAAAPARV